MGCRQSNSNAVSSSQQKCASAKKIQPSNQISSRSHKDATREQSSPNQQHASDNYRSIQMAKPVLKPTQKENKFKLKKIGQLKRVQLNECFTDRVTELGKNIYQDDIEQQNAQNNELSPSFSLKNSMFYSQKQITYSNENDIFEDQTDSNWVPQQARRLSFYKSSLQEIKESDFEAASQNSYLEVSLKENNRQQDASTYKIEVNQEDSNQFQKKVDKSGSSFEQIILRNQIGDMDNNYSYSYISQNSPLNLLEISNMQGHSDTPQFNDLQKIQEQLSKQISPSSDRFFKLDQQEQQDNNGNQQSIESKEISGLYSRQVRTQHQQSKKLKIKQIPKSLFQIPKSLFQKHKQTEEQKILKSEREEVQNNTNKNSSETRINNLCNSRLKKQSFSETLQKLESNCSIQIDKTQNLIAQKNQSANLHNKNPANQASKGSQQGVQIKHQSLIDKKESKILLCSQNMTVDMSGSKKSKLLQFYLQHDLLSKHSIKKFKLDDSWD